MAITDNTYIPVSNTGSARADLLIDQFLSARLERFRQLGVISGETINYGANPLRTTWHPILQKAPLKASRNTIHVNQTPVGPGGTLTVLDYVAGTFNVSPTLERGETLNVMYYWDYFPDFVLHDILNTAMDIVNAYTPATAFKIDMSPQTWNGVIADQAYVLCLEKLILDDTLWEPNLIFNNPESVVSQLESALNGSRERLSTVITQMKQAPYVSPPTWAYYDAIRMGGGRVGFHGSTLGYGKTRGIRINRWFGR